MTDWLASIITQLERQKTGIEQALSALREVEEVVPETTAIVAPVTGNKRSEAQRARWAAKKGADVVPATRKGGMTPEGKARLVDALKRRWAARKAAVAENAPSAIPTKATSKRGISAAGRKALAEAMKRRWAVKRAAVKKRGRARKAA